MTNEDVIDWGKKASTLIRIAMTKQRIKAPELARRLTDAGYPTSAAHINNRLSKGNYKASWFLMVLNFLGETEIHL